MDEAIGHSTNLVGIPAGLLASESYNDYPQALHISGVREMNRSLFTMLGEAERLEEAAEAYYLYMSAVFGLDPEQREAGGGKGGVRRFRSSFLRLLKGWGYDSNSPEGAVLKGWVESRFGLFPTFHKHPITLTSKAWVTYVEEKMSSRFHNNAIYAQLDLLYEFCQWALARFVAPARSHIRLYRGVNDFTEHQLIKRYDKRTCVLRMNSLASFTSLRDVAECFGDTVLETDVPLSKVAFFNTLLPTHPLKGEGEFLVIGGDFKVTAAYW